MTLYELRFFGVLGLLVIGILIDRRQATWRLR
jgi:hypothetical protein